MGASAWILVMLWVGPGPSNVAIDPIGNFRTKERCEVIRRAIVHRTNPQERVEFRCVDNRS